MRELKNKNKRGSKKYVFKSLLMRMLMGIIDVVGTVIVLFCTLGQGLKVNKELIKNPQRILVIRLDHIGDVLFSRPALEALRLLYPHAHITMMVSSTCADLLRLEPTINDLMIWDAPWFNRNARAKKPPRYWKLIKVIRQMKVDLSLDLRGDIRHHILLTLAGVKCRAGHTITGGRFLLHQSIKLRPGVHEVERNLDVVRALAEHRAPVNYPPLALTNNELNQGRQQWSGKRQRVLIHPGAGDPQKCWPLDFFGILCRKLAVCGCQVILVGTNSEKTITANILQQMDTIKWIKDLCGKTTLRELAAIISSAELFIGHDSGPAHIAVTQGIPAIMLWSNTNNPQEWGVWGEQTAVTIIKQLDQENSVNKIMEAAKNKLKIKKY